MEVIQRFSKKRQAIYEVLMNSQEHPSAENIYQTLKPIFPDLSLGTVYRNLKSLVANGDVLCVANVDGKDRFDSCLTPHAHLICSECGGVQDITLPEELISQCREFAERNGVELDLHTLRFTGVCQHCKDRELPDPIIVCQ